MIFNSFTYLIFLGVALGAYWTLPGDLKTGRWGGRFSINPRMLMLFLMSLVFYGFWRWDYIPVMLVSVVVDYVAALKIHGFQTSRVRRKEKVARNAALAKRWMLGALAVNLGLLAYFKYTYFVLENVRFLTGDLSPSWEILLPLGISFYTFQSISYTVDVYRGFIKPEKNFVTFATYVTFFPQLIAGPILRAAEVIPQLKNRPKFQLEDLNNGVLLILSGLFLKVVLADHISPHVDEGFLTDTGTLSALDSWVLGTLFGFQIYFDFAAYSMIAIGSARLMGLYFPKNFDFPYLATSPKEFWKRWHISLSSWVRDYVYLPLCGVTPRDESKGGLNPDEKKAASSGVLGKMWPLVGTWAIMGLWHGSAWTFVVWGLWHAALILIHRWVVSVWKQTGPLTRIMGWLFTFMGVVAGWIWFRATSLEQGWEMTALLLDPDAYLNWDKLEGGYLWAAIPININPLSYLLAGTLLAAHLIVFAVYKGLWPRMGARTFLRLPALFVYTMVVSALVFIYLQPIRQFIYFQF